MTKTLNCLFSALHVLRVELEEQKEHVPSQPNGQDLEWIENYLMDRNYFEITGGILEVRLRGICRNNTHLPQQVRLEPVYI